MPTSSRKLHFNTTESCSVESVRGARKVMANHDQLFQIENL